MKKLKYFIPALIWMIFIFIMSHTNGNDSSNQSNFIAEIILKVINIDRDTLTFIIRKAAHMSEYAILLLLLYYALSNVISKHTLSLSLLVTFIYACSDEFHQLFMEGRAGQFRDVCIDTAGGATGILLWHWIYTYLLKYKQKRMPHEI